jgi:hypothetical protein
MSDVLNRTISAFNNRNFVGAARLAGEGLAGAQGRDELFWMGLLETCEGYDLLARKDMLEAERKLIAAMQKLRNFGFRYRNFEVTVALAGIRLAVEHIRLVRDGRHKVFDVSLHPTLRLAAKADD